MPTPLIVMLGIGLVMLVLGSALAFRLRKRGGTEVMSKPWLVPVVTASFGMGITVAAVAALVRQTYQ
jgi:hypothetical protein